MKAAGLEFLRVENSAHPNKPGSFSGGRMLLRRINADGVADADREERASNVGWRRLGSWRMVSRAQARRVAGVRRCGKSDRKKPEPAA